MSPVPQDDTPAIMSVGTLYAKRYLDIYKVYHNDCDLQLIDIFIAVQTRIMSSYSMLLLFFFFILFWLILLHLCCIKHCCRSILDY